MSMTPEQKKQFMKMLETSSNSLTLKDFEDKFALVLEVIKKIKTVNEESREQLKDKYTNLTETVDKFYKNANDNLEETKRKALAYCVKNCSQESLDLVKSEVSKMTEKVNTKIAQVKDGQPGRDGAKGEQGRPGKDGSPDTAMQIATKLNREEEIIEQKVIKGLDEKIKRLEDLINQKNAFGGGGGGVGKQNVYYYDLSGSLDGSTKTFSMPAFARIINIMLSSAPVLRPTIDWTADASAHSITFTSQIDANPLLNSGQSLIILYAV